jgi:hypothetical protein
MILNIKVTQEDIDCGKRDSIYACPVALAAERLGFRATVGLWSIDLNVSDWMWWRYKLPPDVRNFINAFDHSEPVAPFEFELNVMEGINVL